MKCMKCLTSCCKCLPQRYVMCLGVVFGLGFCYMMRNCLSLAMSEMTFKIIKKINEDYCPIEGNKTDVASSKNAEFHWSASLQHDILSSFYYGYFVSHLPAGILADYFGGKYVFGSGVALSSIGTVLAPELARLSPYALLVCRIVQGIAQGLMFPSMSVLIAEWAPANERATMNGFCSTGIMFGASLGNLISGLILFYIPGWDPVFYIYGALGILWCIYWYLIVYNSPSNHPFITEKEKTMILEQSKTHKKPAGIPFLSILTSKPYWALLLINFGHTWLLFTISTELPMYLSNVLHFDIKTSGAVSALPYVAMWVTSCGFGPIIDWISRHGLMTVTNNRKLFSVLSNILPIPPLLGASFAGCDTVWASACFVLILFTKGIAYPSLRVNNIDLSPNYAGVLMAIMNGTGAITGFLTPLVVRLVIIGIRHRGGEPCNGRCCWMRGGQLDPAWYHDMCFHGDKVLGVLVGQSSSTMRYICVIVLREGTVYEWRTVFIICTAILVVSSIPFIFFGSAEIQPWNGKLTDDERSLGRRHSAISRRQSQISLEG